MFLTCQQLDDGIGVGSDLLLHPHASSAPSAGKLVAVDFDDVLVPCMDYFVDYCNKVKGVSGSLDNLLYPTFDAAFPTCVAEESYAHFEDFVESDWWKRLHEVPPPVGCSAKLWEFKSAGCDLIVVSAREHRFMDITQQYLARFLPGLFKEVILCNYFGIHSSDRITKSQVCMEKKCTLLIDDNYKYFKEVLENAPSVNCILLGESSWTRYWGSEVLAHQWAANWKDIDVRISLLGAKGTSASHWEK